VHAYRCTWAVNCGALALALVACHLESTPEACQEGGGCTRGALFLDAGVGADASPGSDASVTPPRLPDGEACQQDAQCESAHCNHGLCCSGGNCCQVPNDCPGDSGIGMACDDTTTCQGTRGAIMCEAFRCVTRNGVADDTACMRGMVANECGLYRPLSCTGAAEQTAPVCPTACRGDSDCDPGAHCDGTCVANAPAGERCEADAECASGHCVNRVCCASGDCCVTAADCPARFSSAAQCDAIEDCQGARTEAVCANNMCGSTRVEDDSACGPSILAHTCELSIDIFCSGAVAQIALACGSSCTSNAQCDTGAYCNGSACVARQANGATCNDSSQCDSGHCANGYCCSGGSCCRAASDCGSSVTLCDGQCQGHRETIACNAFRCDSSATSTDNDSACGSGARMSCGDYAEVACTGAVNQSPVCGTSCTSSSDCATGRVCTENLCVTPPPTGG
jgi:hypothetical protein